MSRRAMRAALAVFLATALIFCAAVAGAVALGVRYPYTPHEARGRPARVVVERGDLFPAVARRLRDAGVIDSTLAFRLYASWRGLAHRVRPGAYDLSTDMTPRDVLARLVRGVAEPEVAVTIPEGRNLVEVVDLLAAAGVGARGEILRLARDPALARALDVRGETLEGYLFPDTYRLRPGRAEAALRAMHARFREVMDDLIRRHAAGMERLRAALGFDEHRVVILASIVEKETGAPEERPLVASVYLNRLRLPAFQPKLLEADPTITYGCTVLPEPSAACRRFADRIRTAQLRDRENPYNTYVHPGLPPGPIANPGRAALEAILEFADTPHLYFVSRNDGTHQFSATLAEHRAAVDRWQRRGTKASPDGVP